MKLKSYFFISSLLERAKQRLKAKNIKKKKQTKEEEI